MNNQIKSIRKWMRMSIPMIFAFLCSLGTTVAQNDPNTRTLIFHAEEGTFATGKTPGAYTDENKTFTVTNVGIGEDALISTYAPKFDVKPSMKFPKYSSTDKVSDTITNETLLPAGTGAFHIYVLWTNITAEDFKVTLPTNLNDTGESKVVSVVCKTESAGQITVKYKRLPDGVPTEVAPSASGNYQISIDMAASDINASFEGLSLCTMSIEGTTPIPPSPSYYYDIDGQVTDENKAPLVHAKIQLLNQNDYVLKETYTDYNGYYSFESLSEGFYGLSVSHEGYQSNRVLSFYLDTNTTHNVILQPVPTALDTVNESGIHVYGSKASLVIEAEAGKSYRIIGLSGSLANSGITTDNHTKIPLTAGIYIVIIDKQNYKVMVR